jgi:hypothetical protein
MESTSTIIDQRILSMKASRGVRGAPLAALLAVSIAMSAVAVFPPLGNRHLYATFSAKPNLVFLCRPPSGRGVDDYSGSSG